MHAKVVYASCLVSSLCLFAELPACYQNLDDLISKLRSKVHPPQQGAGSTQQKAAVQRNQRTDAAGSRQEPTPDYGAADDEFPQGL